MSELLLFTLQTSSASMETVLLFITTDLSPISILLAPPAAAAVTAAAAMAPGRIDKPLPPHAWLIPVGEVTPIMPAWSPSLPLAGILACFARQGIAAQTADATVANFDGGETEAGDFDSAAGS